MFFKPVQILCVANYNDLSRGHLKWWFSKGVLPKCPQFSVRKEIEVFLSTGNATHLDFSRIPLGAVGHNTGHPDVLAHCSAVIHEKDHVLIMSRCVNVLGSGSTGVRLTAVACEPADDGDGTMQDSKASFVFVS